jgi:hypothetical protein
MILTFDWVIQTALTAGVATGGSLVVTKIAIRLIEGKKKEIVESPPKFCPLQGCLNCQMRNNGHNKPEIVTIKK